MSVKIKKNLALIVEANGKSKMCSIDNSNNNRDSSCWDAVFGRYSNPNKNGKYVFRFCLKSNDNERHSIDEVPTLKLLLTKLKKLYNIDNNNNYYTVFSDSIYMRMLLIRLIRCCNSPAGREYIEESINYSGKRRKNLIYCFHMISIYKSLRNAFEHLRINSRSFLPDHSFYNNYFFISFSRYNDIKNVNMSTVYVSHLYAMRYTSKKDIMRTIKLPNVIRHIATFKEEKSLNTYKEIVNDNRRIKYFKNIEEYNKFLIKLYEDYINYDKNSIAAFEKMFLKHNKMILNLK